MDLGYSKSQDQFINMVCSQGYKIRCEYTVKISRLAFRQALSVEVERYVIKILQQENFENILGLNTNSI